MTALAAASYARQCRNPGVQRKYLMKASTQIWHGGLVVLDSNGLAIPAAASASNNGCVGVAIESKLSAASGDYFITVQEGEFLFNATSIAQSAVGDTMYVVDDDTIDETQASNCAAIGPLVEYVGSTSGWVLAGLVAGKL